jgi:hypothetical protein
MEWQSRSIHVCRLFRKAVVTVAMLLDWQVFGSMWPDEHSHECAILEAC